MIKPERGVLDTCKFVDKTKEKRLYRLSILCHFKYLLDKQMNKKEAKCRH